MFNKVYVTIDSKEWSNEEKKILERYIEKEISLVPFTIRKKDNLSVNLTEIDNKRWSEKDYKYEDGDEDGVFFKVKNIYHDLSLKSSIIILT
jgi:hypothetical protein